MSDTGDLLKEMKRLIGAIRKAVAANLSPADLDTLLAFAQREIEKLRKK